MAFNNLVELVKVVSVDIIRSEFVINKKFPINKELNLDIDKLPEDENGDMARQDPDEFIRLLNNAVSQRLNYMYEEGFLDKKAGYYRAYTSAEIKKQIKDLEKDND